LEGAGLDLSWIATNVREISFFPIHQTSSSMSTTIETRHNIVEMLVQLDIVEALLKVEQLIREALN
jgi:hypothetical protein